MGNCSSYSQVIICSKANLRTPCMELISTITPPLQETHGNGFSVEYIALFAAGPYFMRRAIPMSCPVCVCVFVSAPAGVEGVNLQRRTCVCFSNQAYLRNAKLPNSRLDYWPCSLLPQLIFLDILLMFIVTLVGLDSHLVSKPSIYLLILLHVLELLPFR